MTSSSSFPPEVPSKKPQTELTAFEQVKLSQYEAKPGAIVEARAILEGIKSEMDLTLTDELVLTAAKILGAFGKVRIPKDGSGNLSAAWLATEALINSGKNPAPNFDAMLSNILGVSEKKETAPLMEVDKIREEIARLEQEVMMPLPEKPQDPNDREAILEYRKQLVSRHLKEVMSKNFGFYSTINFESFDTVLQRIIAGGSAVPGFNILHKSLLKSLSDGGSEVNRSFARVTDHQFEELINTIAESKLPIAEETYDEKRMRPVDKSHVAIDATAAKAITRLYTKLEN